MKKKMLVAVVVGLVAMVAGAQTFQPLSVPEMAKWNATHVWTCEYSDLAAVTTTNTALASTVTVVRAKESIELVAMRLDTAFDTANTNYTGSLKLKLGDGSTTDLFMEDTELASDGTEVFFAWGTPFGYAVTATMGTNTLVYLGATTNLSTNIITYVSGVTAATTGTAKGRKYYTADGAVVATLTPNTEEALSANVQGKVRVYFKRRLLGE